MPEGFLTGSMTVKIALVALGRRGNGDDAIGIEILERFKARSVECEIVKAYGGAKPTNALEKIGACDAMIIIDAATMGEAPGAMKILDINEIVFAHENEMTLHGIDSPTEVLMLQKFGGAPHAKLFCIEPFSLEGDTLSSTLLSRMSDYLEALHELVVRLSRSII